MKIADQKLRPMKRQQPKWYLTPMPRDEATYWPNPAFVAVFKAIGSEKLPSREQLRRRIEKMADASEHRYGRYDSPSLWWHDAIMASAPGELLQHFLAYFDLTPDQTGLLLGMSRRRLRRLCQVERLPPVVVDAMMTFIRLWLTACHVFKNEAKVSRWMHRPLKVFNDHSPLEMLGTGDGYKLAMDHLDRIDHGMFA